MGVSFGNSLEADHHGAVGLAAQRDRRLVGHGDDVWRLDDREAIADVRQRGELATQKRVEFGLDDCGLTYEFDLEIGSQRAKRVDGTRDGGLRGKIAPHGIHGDARQAYASCAVTRCSPA